VRSLENFGIGLIVGGLREPFYLLPDMGEDSAHTWTAYLTGRSALTLRRAYRARKKSIFGREA